MAATTQHRENAFVIREFQNRAGSVSFRVMGSLAGRRIRENFPTKAKADARRFELEGLRLGMTQPEAPRVTTLTPAQLEVAEWIYARGAEPDEVRRGWEWWESTGRAMADARRAAGSISVAEAGKQFRAFVESAADLRPRTKQNLDNRVLRFETDLGDKPLADVTPEVVEQWLAGRDVSPASRVNDRLALSRFFSWCVQRPQRFVLANPISEVRLPKEERGLPAIYSSRQIRRILVAARRSCRGRWLKLVVLQLFGGMRPAEAVRFADGQVVDGHLRVEGRQAKTGKARVIDADPLLLAWLRLCHAGSPGDPQKSRLAWDKFRRAARVEGDAWIDDGLRHTAVSHFFRRCGSYGLTAEWAGNSEAVIRAHYAARTSVAESAAYWTLFPSREERHAARAPVKETGVHLPTDA